MKMKKEEQKIVVAVDESEESMYALSWCLENLLPHSDNTTLVLLYVKPPPTIYALDAAGYMFSGDVIASLEKYGSDLVNSVMARAEAVIRNFRIDNANVERIIGSGDAKDVICSSVNKIGADTLVMGSHGYGFFKRALLGSVSDYCAKHAKCPVVIVKHPDSRS